ncbi:hypothetical protein [Spirosoma aerophilum]
MKTLHSIAILVITLLTLASCSTKMSFLNSTVAPAATGQVNVKKDKNANYSINVRVRNLAEPKQLTPAKETYIVWMESDKDPVKKLGQIKPSSRALTGSLTATDIGKPINVFITAEDNVDVQYPDGQTVLTTRK